MLTLGKVYYDKTHKKIIYNLVFPENQTWVIADTSFYCVVNNKVKERQTIPPIATFSVFNICLNGELPDYGLKNSSYKPSSVEKEDDMIITTYTPPAKLNKQSGKILLSQKDRKLYGIVILNTEGELLSKQIFRNYVNANGLFFPLEIIQFSYKDGEESYQVSTYKNVIVNETSDDTIYNYIIPR